MRSRFDEQLSLLNKKMIEMGTECESIINLSVKALIEGDTTCAETAKHLRGNIDHMERDIESICIKLLLQQQPVARDLRVISAAPKMITDMERIGDQAENITDIVASLNGRNDIGCENIRIMAEAAMKMVTKSIDAYVKQDMELSNDVINYDDVVDDAFDRVKQNLIKMISENVSDGEYALDLLMIAKYFEKIGDHAVNIAEWVEYSLTGVHKG